MTDTIYTAAGMDQSDMDKLRTSLEVITKDNASQDIVIRRGVERYDREAFVAGLLIGIELRLMGAHK